MTLIAAFQRNGAPALLGDLLISGESASQKPVSIPTLGDVSNFFADDAGWAIQGMTQKLAIVDDQLAIGWSDSELGAAIAINHLRDMAKKGPLTKDLILYYLYNDQDLRQHKISLVAALANDTGIEVFGYDAQDFRDDSKRVSGFFSGSGSSEIHKYFALPDTEINGVGEPPRHAFAIQDCCILAGMLIEAEVHGGDSARTLRACFGGGYEICYFIDGKFKKLDSVNFFVWDYGVVKGKGFGLTCNYMTAQRYIGNNLFINSARLRRNGRQNEVVLEEQRNSFAKTLFENEPRIYGSADLTQPANHQIHVFYDQRATQTGKGLLIPIYWHFADENTANVRLTKNGSTFEFVRTDQFTQFFRTTLKRYGLL